MSAAEAAPVASIALIATAAERISLEFFMAHPVELAMILKKTPRRYSSANPLSVAILRIETILREVLQKRTSNTRITSSSRHAGVNRSVLACPRHARYPVF
jgi:hypothetical protein